MCSKDKKSHTNSKIMSGVETADSLCPGLSLLEKATSNKEALNRMEVLATLRKGGEVAGAAEGDKKKDEETKKG